MPSRRPAPPRAARATRVSLRRLLAATLAAYALALFRRHLLQALAHAGALLRAHPLPALVVLHHALLLLGRQALEGPEALEDALALLGGQVLEAVVGLLQLLAARVRQLVPALEILQDALALGGRQGAEVLDVVARGAPILGRKRAPLAIALQRALPLFRRHAPPPLGIALDDRALVGGQRLGAGRRLAPGDLEHRTGQDRGQRDGDRQPTRQRSRARLRDHASAPSAEAVELADDVQVLQHVQALDDAVLAQQRQLGAQCGLIHGDDLGGPPLVGDALQAADAEEDAGREHGGDGQRRHGPRPPAAARAGLDAGANLRLVAAPVHLGRRRPAGGQRVEHHAAFFDGAPALRADGDVRGHALVLGRRQLAPQERNQLGLWMHRSASLQALAQGADRPMQVHAHRRL